MSISAYDISNIGNIISGNLGDWFTADLLRLMAKSDKDNLRRLGRAYPDVFTHFCHWRYGGVPAEYADEDDIREYVNGSGVDWLKEGTINTHLSYCLVGRGGKCNPTRLCVCWCHDSTTIRTGLDELERIFNG